MSRSPAQPTEIFCAGTEAHAALPGVRTSACGGGAGAHPSPGAAAGGPRTPPVHPGGDGIPGTAAEGRPAGPDPAAGNGAAGRDRGWLGGGKSSGGSRGRSRNRERRDRAGSGGTPALGHRLSGRP